MEKLGERAVVIGGSVAGVLAAALADRYERVTVLERDALPEVGAPTYAAFNDAYFAGDGFELARVAAGKTAITASRPFEGHMRRRALAAEVETLHAA
jgi:glycine/D-amino acid oxidase-like deaminating enzyme